MLFYTAKLICIKGNIEQRNPKNEVEVERSRNRIDEEIRKFVGFSEYNPISSFCIVGEEQETKRIGFACNRVGYSMGDILEQLALFVEKNTGCQYEIKKVKEITGEEYVAIYGYHNGNDIELNYFDDCKEHFAEDSHSDIGLDLRDKICLMTNEMLEQEIKRIEAKENRKKYVGNVVHYIIKTTDAENANSMVNLLTGALFNNKRLLSKRVTLFHTDNQRPFFSQDLKQALIYSSGTTMVIDLMDKSSYGDVLEELARMLPKYSRNTLFIFLIDDKLEEMVSYCKENKLKTLLLEDGVSSRERALEYIHLLAAKFPLGKTSRKSLENYLPVMEKYDFATLNEAYNSFYDSVLLKKYYPAYNIIEKEDHTESSTQELYKKLEQLIGLAEVKRLLHQIVTYAKYNELRRKAKLKAPQQSLHMCFKGNPGTAKTTVARLLGKILKAEGILTTGKFVECGRANLVARYVGWTAKTVKQRFREAKGGILFIDEAYSLVESEKSFASEAIDTIVQEMENNREDTIVIFAGYAEPMEQFLKMNEGLRSRVPYHLDFKNYSTEELYEIFELLAKERGYVIDKSCAPKIKAYFAEMTEEKNFGNGRFVRNFLEKVILEQAERIMTKKKATAEELQLLRSVDIEACCKSLPVKEMCKIGLNLQ